MEGHKESIVWERSLRVFSSDNEGQLSSLTKSSLQWVSLHSGMLSDRDSK